MKYIILHGTGATPEHNWFRWLEGELIEAGHEVWLPQLPGADEPQSSVYVPFLLSQACPFELDDEVVLIGHSSGAVAILHVLQALSGSRRIKGAILVSAFADDLGWESLTGLFESEFDFAVIKESAERLVLVHSDNDPYVPLDQAEYLAAILKGELEVYTGQGHFNTEVGEEYRRFPRVLELALSLA